MFGVEDAWKEYGAISFPIELQAATTDDSSMHIGITYYFLLITINGTTAKGNDSFPITFSIILSAFETSIPPFLKADRSNYPFALSEITVILSCIGNL